MQNAVVDIGVVVGIVDVGVLAGEHIMMMNRVRR